MISTDVGETSPVICVTPLYRFSSRSKEMSLGEGIRICRYDSSDFSSDELLSTLLSIHEPDFLLWYDPVISKDISPVELAGHLHGLIDFEESKVLSLIKLLTERATPYFLVLRLFKPGRLRAGETYIIARGGTDKCVIGSGRASMMTVDYGMLGIRTGSYGLEGDEIPFLAAFREETMPLLDSLNSYPALAAALALYSEDHEETVDAVGSVTALEALLTKAGETEGLSYRLSLRIANLLGCDATSRKGIFKEVKNFYNLRSRIVHGAPPDDKLLGRLNVDSMRETLRRVLLSVMALYSEGIRPADLPDRLDDLALDDEARKQFSATASKFLHIIAKVSP